MGTTGVVVIWQEEDYGGEAILKSYIIGVSSRPNAGFFFRTHPLPLPREGGEKDKTKKPAGTPAGFLL